MNKNQSQFNNIEKQNQEQLAQTQMQNEKSRQNKNPKPSVFPEEFPSKKQEISHGAIVDVVLNESPHGNSSPSSADIASPQAIQNVVVNETGVQMGEQPIL